MLRVLVVALLAVGAHAQTHEASPHDETVNGLLTACSFGAADMNNPAAYTSITVTQDAAKGASISLPYSASWAAWLVDATGTILAHTTSTSAVTSMACGQPVSHCTELEEPLAHPQQCS